MRTFRVANWIKILVLVFMTGALGEALNWSVAEARAGGSRSMGRSSRPSNNFQTPPNRSPQMNQPMNTNRGGFMSGLAGGLAGGLLGSMLFSSIGNASGMGGGMGGGGIGFIEIILIACLAYLAFRWWKSRQQPALAYSGANVAPSNFGGFSNNQPPNTAGFNQPELASSPIDTEDASDIFFKVQAAWTRRDLSSVRDLVGHSLLQTLTSDIDLLKQKQRTNRLENISVRRTEVLNSWREDGKDLSTVRLTANLLDYTVQDGNPQVIEGSDTVPVKFEEDWTFEKQSHGQWQLVGIQQV